MILIISTINNNFFDQKHFFWGSKYLSSIKKYLPTSENELKNIKEGIVFFNKTQNRQLNSLRIKIIDIILTSNYLKINFNLGEETNYKSFQVRDALKKYLNIHSSASLNTVLELPFCSAVDENLFNEILSKDLLASEIKFLQDKNQWEEIYNLYLKHLPVEQNKIWNEPEILSSFSFGIAKLSEWSRNLKKEFSSKEEFNNFINEKKRLRKLCIKLRKRCIELDPLNPSFYSNLAYSHYQSIYELSGPNRRRDGSLIEDAKLAIQYLNKALEFDPDRISDLYRRGLIYFNFLSKISRFNNSTEQINGEISFLEIMKKAKEDFLRIINIYEKLPDSTTKLRYRKYYIRSNYNLAKLFLKLTRYKFEPIYIRRWQLKNDKLDQNKAQARINLLNTANKYITRCILEDNYKKQLKTLIEQGTVNNFIIGVYKLYLSGMILINLYLLTRENNYKTLGMKFLLKANEINFPGEIRQNKLFILDKIAQIKIFEESYSDAIKLLEPFYKGKKNFPDYTAYTLAIAYFMNNDKSQAKELINLYSQKMGSPMREKFNKLNEIFFGKRALENITRFMRLN